MITKEEIMALAKKLKPSGRLNKDDLKRAKQMIESKKGKKSISQREKALGKNKATGKPKGTSSALGIVGSASKAGMQSKQKPIRRPMPPGNMLPEEKPKRGINLGNPIGSLQPEEIKRLRKQFDKMPNQPNSGIMEELDEKLKELTIPKIEKKKSGGKVAGRAAKRGYGKARK